MGIRLAWALVLAPLLLAGCGGGSKVQGVALASAPMAAPAAAAAQPILPSAQQVMQWAEWVYPQHFAPGLQPIQSAAPFTYRYYPSTGNYLGFADNGIWTMGPVSGPAPAYVASMTDMACVILAQNCPPPPPLPGPFTVVPASVSLMQPTSLNRSVYQGQGVGDGHITIAFSGDDSVLDNQTLYFLVLDRAGLFQASADIRLSDANIVVIGLEGKMLESVGTHTGEIHVYACLDAACSRRLGNLPLRVPYAVTVKQGLALGTPSLHFRSTFGKPVTPVDVPIAAAPGPVPGLSNLTLGSTQPWLKVSLADVNASNTQGVLRFDLAMLPPGTHDAQLSAASYLVDGSTQRWINVRYVVDPDPSIEYGFDPPALAIQMRRTETSYRRSTVRVALKTNTVMSAYDPRYEGEWNARQGIDWISLVWGDWREGFAITVNPCAGYPVKVCLAPGTYRATVEFRYYDNLITWTPREVLYPVTLTITP